MVTGTLINSPTKTVEVSVSQFADADFKTVGTHVFIQKQDEEYTYSFQTVVARYVRMTFVDHYPEGAYAIEFVFLIEVEVYTPTKK